MRGRQQACRCKAKKGREVMKRSILVLGLVLAVGLMLFPIEGRAHMGRHRMRLGMMGPWGGYGSWYCPYCGRGYGMGSRMMGPGYGMGPGMMHHGWGMGPHYDPQYQQPQRPLEEKDVKVILENYLRSTRNPNLKLGQIKDMGSFFEAEILTKDDSLADKIAVDNGTGWMRSIY